MAPQRRTSGTGRWSQLLWLPLAALIALALASPGRAQETPESTPAAPEEGVAVVRLVAPAEPVTVGDEFEVQVLVEDVEHLASFAFAIGFDPEHIRPVAVDRTEDGTPAPTPEGGGAAGDIPVESRNVGQFLAASERGEGLLCRGPLQPEGENAVSASCVTTGPPVCAEGLPGASGSGLAGVLVFEAVSEGVTALELTDSDLVLDDIVPCDLQFPRPPDIPHRRENATVEVQESSSFPWLIVGPVIGVVALLVLGGGIAGYVWYGRRGAGTPA